MSVFYDNADQIKERIETIYDEKTIIAIVHRQKDIKSEFERVQARIKGAVAVIEWIGAKDFIDLESALRSKATYSLLMIFKPVIRDPHETKADDILESVAKSLHGWELSNAVHCSQEVELESILPIQDPNFLIYEIRLNILTKI